MVRVARGPYLTVDGGIPEPDGGSPGMSLRVVSEKDLEEWVLVRVRLFPDRRRRDYRGERYTSLEGPLGDFATPSPIPCKEGEICEPPRLVRPGADGGSDQTPATEPLPVLTVDRLARVKLYLPIERQAHLLDRPVASRRQEDRRL